MSSPLMRRNNQDRAHRLMLCQELCRMARMSHRQYKRRIQIERSAHRTARNSLFNSHKVLQFQPLLFNLQLQLHLQLPLLVLVNMYRVLILLGLQADPPTHPRRFSRVLATRRLGAED